MTENAGGKTTATKLLQTLVNFKQTSTKQLWDLKKFANI